MTVALAAVTASAVLGLLTPPPRRHLAWAGTVCALMLLASSALILLTAILMLTGDFRISLFTGTLATSVLFPAFWLARSPEAPPTPSDGHEDDGSDGGGGPPGPPRDPEPGPPAPSLDWDAFDEAREAWVNRGREPIGA